MKNLRFFFMMITLIGFFIKPFEAGAYQLRVLSFNVRVLSNEDGPLNLWESRRDALCNYVKQVHPDIFGMQEVTKPQLIDIVDRIPGYTHIGVARDDGKEKGEYIPVFYRTERYNLIDKGWFWLSETPDKPSKGWNAACIRIATWVILEDKKDKTRFFYCNTHFDHISVQARMESAKLTKKKFKMIAGNLPMFFTADFNTNEFEKTYDLLCNYGYPYSDTWKTAKKREGGPATFNGWGKAENIINKKIDFIFVSPFIQATKAVIHDSSFGGGHYLSDHNCIWADVNWK